MKLDVFVGSEGEMEPKVIRRKPNPGLNSEDEKDAFRVRIRDILKDVLQSMLQYPEKSDVFFIKGSSTTVYEIDIDQSDFGRLMGSKGKHINALRTIVTAIACGQDFRAIVTIKDSIEDAFLFGARYQLELAPPPPERPPPPMDPPLELLLDEPLKERLFFIRTVVRISRA